MFKDVIDKRANAADFRLGTNLNRGLVVLFYRPSGAAIPLFRRDESGHCSIVERPPLFTPDAMRAAADKANSTPAS